MIGVDWQIIVTSFAITMSMFLVFILIGMLRESMRIKKLNDRVQGLLDQDEVE